MSDVSSDFKGVPDYDTTRDFRQWLVLLAAAGTLVSIYRNSLMYLIAWDVKVLLFKESPLSELADAIDDISPLIMAVGLVAAFLTRRYGIAMTACGVAVACTATAWGIYTWQNFGRLPKTGPVDVLWAFGKVVLQNGVELIAKTALPLFTWFLLSRESVTSK